MIDLSLKSPYTLFADGDRGVFVSRPQTTTALRSVPAPSARVRRAQGGGFLCGEMFQQSFGLGLDIDPLWCAWFSGFVDGEGCFSARFKRGEGKKGISASLKISLRNDDAPLILKIQEILKCGSIKLESNKLKREKGYKAQDGIIWTCERCSECRHILIPLFDKYPLRSKKARDYNIWRELVMLLSEDRHLHQDREHILELCQQLKDIKQYDPRIMDAYQNTSKMERAA